MLFLRCVIATMLVQLTNAQNCGFGSFKTAGSTIVQPLSVYWAYEYNKICPEPMITVEGGGSSIGANRGCNATENVEVASLSRPWKVTEATVAADGFTYTCKIGTTPSRVFSQVDVAIDGIPIIIERLNNTAKECLDLLPGGGITSRQLRWMFSNSTASSIETGVVPNSDGNPATRKWSELNAGCKDVPIIIAGPSSSYDTYDFFKEVMFTQAPLGSETFRAEYVPLTDNSNELRNFLLYTDGSIGYLGYSYYSRNKLSLMAVPIDGIEPTTETLTTGQYAPLGRRLYSSFLKTDESMGKTKCWLDFALSDTGATIANQAGLLPIPTAEYPFLKARLPGSCKGVLPTPPPVFRPIAAPVGAPNCGFGSFKTAGSTTVQPLSQGWATEYSKICPLPRITVEGGSSSTGANRGCNATENVEVASLSRPWKVAEATVAADGFTYTCKIGTTPSRVFSQVDVAIDGIPIVIERLNNTAKDCIDRLPGQSISLSQLRWMFSNLTASSIETGVVANSDGNPATRKWSELNAGCKDAPIIIAGPNISFGTYDFFKEVIFTQAPFGSETFRAGYVTFADNSNELRNFLLNTDGSIGYLGFAYYNKNKLSLRAIGINGIEPSPETLSAGQYAPLGRRLHSNFLKTDESMGKTKCWLDFCLSDYGAAIADQAGILPIPAAEYPFLKARLPGSCKGAPTPPPVSRPIAAPVGDPKGTPTPPPVSRPITAAPVGAPKGTPTPPPVSLPITAAPVGAPIVVPPLSCPKTCSVRCRRRCSDICKSGDRSGCRSCCRRCCD